MSTERKATNAQIFVLFLKGFTYAEIGRRVGLSPQRIQQICRPPVGIFNMVRDKARSACQNCKMRVRAGEGHIHNVECFTGVPDTFSHVDKLIYLCRPCHATVHGKRGKHDS